MHLVGKILSYRIGILLENREFETGVSRLFAHPVLHKIGFAEGVVVVFINSEFGRIKINFE
jgi:hypothetical protein